MSTFLEVQPSLTNQWRALMLFGRNVASYKFALARSLLEFGNQLSELIRMEELAEPFARHVCQHLAGAPRQATSQTSRFLDSCSRANAGELGEAELHATTVRLGFANVIDAFHRLGPADLPTRFFIDERRESGGIRITDSLRSVSTGVDMLDLDDETEARWRLVETAWELGLTHSLIEHDRNTEQLTVRRREGRTNVTSARAALNGYQKGRCFYCFAPITTYAGDELADVDHFFPWSIRRHLPGNVNGVWNLVLACPRCNRGEAGKHDLVPTRLLLERLHRRNEFLISSHHPLRETLMLQTGVDVRVRISFLQVVYAAAIEARVAQWQPAAAAEAAF
jgi:5-methylcytosine-specific restriction endonuclease McrA